MQERTTPGRPKPGTAVGLEREGTVVFGVVWQYDPATVSETFPVAYSWRGNRIWTTACADDCKPLSGDLVIEAAKAILLTGATRVAETQSRIFPVL